MHIRRATADDLPVIMAIFAHAREFMVAHGNPTQWAHNGWPPQELIEEDIAVGKSYVCVNGDRVVGTFYFEHGHDIDPTYRTIEDGAWIGNDTYSVVHRIASDHSVRGIGTACLEWAFEQHGHVRIDTHEDNTVFQNLLAKLGYSRCGIIHLIPSGDPRIAYEKVRA